MSTTHSPLPFCPECGHLKADHTKEHGGCIECDKNYAPGTETCDRIYVGTTEGERNQ